MPSARHVVYGASVDELSTVFIERGLAVDLAQTRSVLDSATTWGELRAGLSSARFAECSERIADANSAPSDAAPFAAGDLSEFSDGDWPEWPATEHFRWMPEDAQALGRRRSTVLNADVLEFTPETEAAVIAALERAGYSVNRDLALVAAAQGIAS